jgi:osmotically-inducible protein OsmY
MNSDRQIQHDVLDALEKNREVVSGTIGVEVHHGVVKLAGRVGNAAIRKSAETTAGRVADVTTVVMDVDVGGEAAARPESFRGSI